MPEDSALTEAERAELERLRAENAALRRAGPGGAGPGAEPSPAARRRWPAGCTASPTGSP